MTKEELIKLNEDIGMLSSSDIKERDLYLRELATGEIQGPPVGRASIDKPWLKYYDEEKYKVDFPKEIFYEGLLKQNINNLDNVAINYFFTNITFRKFFENANSLIKAMSNYGVKNGDSVGICLASIPESMYAISAVSYLGAIGVFLPPYLDKKSIIVISS